MRYDLLVKDPSEAQEDLVGILWGPQGSDFRVGETAGVMVGAAQVQ